MWNYPGLGNLVTEKELGDLIWAKNLSVVFIVEIRTDEARLKEIKCKLKFDHMFLVPWIHRGGGLVFFSEGVNEFASGDIFKKSHRLYH